MKSEMDKVRIGLIGVGNIAQRHALAYMHAANAEIHAVCDVNHERVEQRAEEWGAAKAYTDYHDLLADADVDAVEIITPHHLHARRCPGSRQTRLDAKTDGHDDRGM